MKKSRSSSKGIHLIGREIMYTIDRKSWPVFRDDEGWYAIRYEWNEFSLQHTHLTIIPITIPTTTMVIRPTWRSRHHWISDISATGTHITISPA
jgi:hypothetical protein